MNKKTYSALVLTIISCSFLLYASSGGVTGVTKKNGAGCTCHSAEPGIGVTVIISGPDTLAPGETGNYTVSVSGGPLSRAGVNIASSDGVLNPGEGLKKVNAELTHTSPKAPAEGTVLFSFTYTAPDSDDSAVLYAVANSVNFNGNNSGDSWNFSADKEIAVVDGEVPVELNAFAAAVNGTDVTLRWSTATETNNSGFELQRATGDNMWQNIGYIRGSGTTTEKRYYEFTDKNLLPGLYTYRLKQTDYDGTYKYYNLEGSVEITNPSAYELKQNFPNPFNPSTTIAFSLSQAAEVNLKIFNLAGEEVSALDNGIKEAGFYKYNFDGKNLSSGVYYYSLTAKSPGTGQIMYNEVKKMLLIK